MVSRVAAGHNCWLSDNSLCAAAITRYIQNMVNGTSTAGGGSSITIIAPADPNKVPGGGLIYPANAAGPPSFQTLVYDRVLRPYCVACHRENANQGTPPQSPFFASDDINSAYAGDRKSVV